MSSDPGKVEIQGVTEINGEKVLALRLIQGRNPALVLRPFFSRYDEQATWLNHLQPAFGEERFFFVQDWRRGLKRKCSRCLCIGGFSFTACTQFLSARLRWF